MRALVIRLVSMVVCLVLAALSFGAFHEEWDDLSLRSLLIKCRTAAIDFPPATLVQLFDSSAVSDSELLAAIVDSNPYSVEIVFSDIASRFGPVPGVDLDNSYLIAFPEGTNVDSLVVELGAVSVVEHVCSNNSADMLQFCDAQHDANDEYSQQWYLHPEAQGGIGYCPAHVIEGEYATWTPSVGIVDSGVNGVAPVS